MIRCLFNALLLLWPGLAAGQTIFAAASLTSALVALKPYCEDLQLSLASSSTLAKQIAAGAPADLYFSASVAWMDYLQARDLIEPNTRTDLLSNALVFIAPRDETFPVRVDKGFDLAAVFTGRLAMGDPAHVPAGLYARQALVNLGWWPALKDRIAPAPNVRAALTYVERGECAAGLVYATDRSEHVAVLATVPDSLHTAIIYPLAVISGRADDATRRLLTFLRSDLAADLFRRHGFTVLSNDDLRP